MNIYAPQFHVREALEGPEAEAVRKALFSALLGDSRHIKHCMDQGLPPADFAVARALLDAVTAAGVIVRQHGVSPQAQPTGEAS